MIFTVAIDGPAAAGKGTISRAVAARFGFATAWVNRSGVPIDRLPHGPAHILPDLTHLPEIA